MARRNAVIRGALGNALRALGKLVEDRAGRREAGCERDAVPMLELAECRLQGLPARIPVAGVDEVAAVTVGGGGHDRRVQRGARYSLRPPGGHCDGLRME